MRNFGRREPGQYILHVFKRINAEAFAGFDDAHDSSSSAAAFFRAGKEPVTSLPCILDLVPPPRKVLLEQGRTYVEWRRKNFLGS